MSLFFWPSYLKSYLIVLSTELLAYYRQISQGILTVVDVETTGCQPPFSRVIEVSVLQATLKDGILHQQTDVLNPQVKVPAGITRLTGITQEMVNGAPFSSDIWHRYLPLLNTGALTAHNLSFDYRFLKSEFNYVNTPFSRLEDEQLCTVMLSRLLLPELPSRSLPNLVEYFGFDVGRSHRAEADTLACWLLAAKLLTRIQNEADEVLLAHFMEEWLPLKVAARILKATHTRQARKWLADAGIQARLTGRFKTPMYQRKAIEQVYWQLVQS